MGHGQEGTIASPNAPATIEDTANPNAGPGNNVKPPTPTPSPNVQSSDTTEPAVHGTANALWSPGLVPQKITITGKTVTSNSASQYIIGSQTVIPEASGITIDGTFVSLQSSATALVVGPSTRPFAVSQTPDIVTIDGLRFTRGPGSNIVIGKQTITPGASAIMISGTPVSLAADGTAVAIGGTTFSVPGPASSPSTVQFNGKTFTRTSGSYLAVGSQTLTPGAPAITVSGSPILLAADGTALVVGDSTTGIPIHGQTSTPVIREINGMTFTQTSGSAFAIGSQTLVPGAPAITISGTPVSLPADGTAIVIGSSTMPPLGSTTIPVVLDLNGNSYTETSGSDFIIGSQTLIPEGPAIAVNGTLVSLAPAATALVIGTQTEALTTSQGLGEIVMGGFYSGVPGAPTARNGSHVAGFTGGSPKIAERRFDWVVVRVVLTYIFVRLL